MDENTKLACRAIIEDWNISTGTQDECVERLTEGLRMADNPRDIARIVTAFAKLKGQNIQVRLADKYLDAVGESVQERVLKPWEVASVIISSVGITPATESIAETPVTPEKSACPPLAGPDTSRGAFGAGIW